MEEKIKICRELARNSDCNRMRFGSILENEEGLIIGRGFNKKLNLPSLNLLLDCCKLRDQMKIPSGWRGELCKAIHAEQAAVKDALDRGYSVKGGIITVCGFYPDGRLGILKEANFYCTLCSRFLFMFGVKAVQVVVGDGKKYSLEKLSVEEMVLRSYESAIGLRSAAGSYDVNKLDIAGLGGCDLKNEDEISPRTLLMFYNYLLKIRKTIGGSEQWNFEHSSWQEEISTVLIVQDYFGGAIVKVNLKENCSLRNRNIHLYNVLKNGSVIDFTYNQFPEWASFYFENEEKIGRWMLLDDPRIENIYKILKAEFDGSALFSHEEELSPFLFNDFSDFSCI